MLQGLLEGRDLKYKKYISWIDIVLDPKRMMKS